MKIEKRDYIYWAFAVIVITSVVFVAVNRKDATDKASEVSASLSPSPSLSTAPVATAKIPTPTPSAKPNSGIIAEEVGSYENLVKQHDDTGTRLALNATCTFSEPSNTSYKNDTLIMIDNKASSVPRTVRIGERSYDIAAYGWYLTTLHSNTLPVDLGFYCNSLELGSIRLEK